MSRGRNSNRHSEQFAAMYMVWILTCAELARALWLPLVNQERPLPPFGHLPPHAGEGTVCNGFSIECPLPPFGHLPPQAGEGNSLGKIECHPLIGEAGECAERNAFILRPYRG